MSWKFVRTWREIYPGAVDCLEDGHKDLFSFFKLEQEWWSESKTTNLLERAFEGGEDTDKGYGSV